MRRADSDEAGTAEALVLNEALDRLLDPLDDLASFGAHPRTAGTDRVPALSGARAPRGTDVFTSVTLRAREVRAGVRPIVRFTLSEPCPECGGAGSAELPGEECGYCGGRGVVEAERLLGLRIPAGIGDGAEFRVRGEGNVPPDGAPGDLFVHVRVAPRAKRPNGTLYTLFAAAVVVLAVLAYLRFLK
jgi:DnaJ-class molecular chaperone